MAQTYTVSFRAGHSESIGAARLDVRDGSVLALDDKGDVIAAYPKESIYGISRDEAEEVTTPRVVAVLRDAAYKIGNGTYTPFRTDEEGSVARDWLNRLADQYAERDAARRGALKYVS